MEIRKFDHCGRDIQAQPSMTAIVLSLLSTIEPHSPDDNNNLPFFHSPLVFARHPSPSKEDCAFSMRTAIRQ